MKNFLGNIKIKTQLRRAESLSKDSENHERDNNEAQEKKRQHFQCLVARFINNFIFVGNETHVHAEKQKEREKTSPRPQLNLI